MEMLWLCLDVCAEKWWEIAVVHPLLYTKKLEGILRERDVATPGL